MRSFFELLLVPCVFLAAGGYIEANCQYVESYHVADATYDCCFNDDDDDEDYRPRRRGYFQYTHKEDKADPTDEVSRDASWPAKRGDFVDNPW